MIIVLNIFLLLLCIFTFYEDWKYRGVSWPIFPVILIITLLLMHESVNSWVNVGLNFIFIVLVLLSLTLYLSLKNRSIINIFKSDFGLGDAFFLIVIAPLFVNQNYIVFFITGMFISGLSHVLINMFHKNKSVPLAGYLAVYLNIWLITGLIFDKDLFTGPLL